MPFPFSAISTLLERLEEIQRADPPLLLEHRLARTKECVVSWFSSHRRAINDLDVDDATALLSAFLPERRTDRVYGLQPLSLCRILKRGLNLGAARAKELQAFTQSGRGDLAECVRRVLEAGGPPAQPIVPLGEVDGMLLTLAGCSRFSAPNVPRLPLGSSQARDRIIANIFKRVSPSEGKWLTRIILKDLSPVNLNENLVLWSFHFILPDLLRFQNEFKAAISLLKGSLKALPERPDPRTVSRWRQDAEALVVPEVGVKVSRPNFHKARSIEHCLRMMGQKKWVVERKYDGEYCEIHVDVQRSSNPVNCIQIFSKSGKDSTQDRRALHQTLVDCLRLGKPDCLIKRQAILLGELVVFSDRDNEILPFDKIRRHVSRAGSFLNVEHDSPAQSHEHLAVVFFDLLLWDDDVILRRTVEERRLRLQQIYRKIPGRAMSAEWKVIDFAESEPAAKRLAAQFAAAMYKRCEGLVLKPCSIPYVSLGPGANSVGRSYIKLKKDYIIGLGDDADFAVIGASYDAQRALKADIARVRWTDFHIGCLTNKEDCSRFDARPLFQVVGTIKEPSCIPDPILRALNTSGAFRAEPYHTGQMPTTFDVQLPANLKMDVTFEQPAVVEILGSGFEKAPTAGFFMLRHPRMTKLHEDRSWRESISFQELQAQAVEAREAPVDDSARETREWLEKMESKLKYKCAHQYATPPRSGQTSTPTAFSVCASATGQLSGVYMPSGSAARQVALSPSSPTATDVASVFLDGTTEVEQPVAHAKRPCASDPETPSPKWRKRQRTDGPERAILSTRRTNCRVLQKASPLSEIINETYASPVSELDVVEVESESTVLPGLRCGLTTLFRPVLGPSSPVATHGALACTRSRCLFARSTIYLASCITSTLLITEDLLSEHDANVTSDLNHWNRDSLVHAPGIEIVAESPAYARRHKLVLVESRRKRATAKIIQQLLQLNDGRFRERVEVYDWRVLDSCSRHDQGPETLKKYCVGATMFNERDSKPIFDAVVPAVGD